MKWTLRVIEQEDVVNDGVELKDLREGLSHLESAKDLSGA